MSIFSTLSRDSTSVLVLIIAVEAIIIVALISRQVRLHRTLAKARKLAEDSAKAAALAVPGGIDPEVVMNLLKAGKPVTVDTVYAAMEAQHRQQQQQPVRR